MTDFAKVRAILDAATPGPWFRWHGDDDHCMNAYAVTTEPCDHEFTSDDGHPSHVIALTLLQQPRLASLGHEPREVTLTDRNVDAMRWDENARAIVVARNLASEWNAVAEAAGREHWWVETVNSDGDDWIGCLCGESGGCATLHALDALHAKMKETL